MTDEPIHGLEGLRVPPPPDLEDAVVDRLTARGWIASPRRSPAPARPRRAGWVPWIAAAAGLAIFVLGVMVGAGSRTGAVGEGPRFLVLLYEGSGFDAPDTPEEHAAIVREYVVWSDSVRAAGFGLSGEELAGRGRRLVPDSEGVEVETGDVAPADGEVLTGFHVLSASSFNAAIEVARSHPHLRRGGRVVVRPIVER